MTKMSQAGDAELKILISCVSDEFHSQGPSEQTRFESYRDSLAADLRRSRIKHVVQEDLAQGFGGLLQTLDEEVTECDLVLHLIGDMAGAFPKEEELRQLRMRHPRFFTDQSIISIRIHEETPISYTQWEHYLAYLHGTKRLVFVAADEAPRSPAFRSNHTQEDSQFRHRQLIEDLGEHREKFFNADNLCRKVITTLVARKILSAGPPVESTEHDIMEARAGMTEIVTKIRERLKSPQRSQIPVAGRSSAHDLVRFFYEVAKECNIDTADLISLLQEHQRNAKIAADMESTPVRLVDLALAQLACGEYEQAAESAREAVRQSEKHIVVDPTQSDKHRESALNAYLLLSDAATASHRGEQAVQSLLEGGALISRTDEPVFWAEFHEQIAKTLMHFARYTEAEPLIRDIIDIRVHHLGEKAPPTGKALSLLGDLLFSTGKYLGAEVVANRILRSHSSNQGTASDLQWDALILLEKALDEQADYTGAEEACRCIFSVARAYGSQSSQMVEACNRLAWVLRRTGKYKEAETFFRQSLKIAEDIFDANSLSITSIYNGLAIVLRDTNRHAEAEELFRSSLAIEEDEYGAEHPSIATTYYEIAKIMSKRGRHLDAAEMFRKALAIDKKFLGETHPFVGVDLVHLAQALSEGGSIDQAEDYWSRGSSILENRRDANHHRIGLAHWHLAEHRERQRRYQEALGEAQFAVRLLTAAVGEHHSDTCKALETLKRIEKARQEYP